MWLPKAIINDVTERVEVFYLTYAATRHWAEHRAKGEPLVFSGWYWAQGIREGGPFKSQSACYRDAWFRVVNKRTPPVIHADAVEAEKYLQRKKNRESKAA